MNAFDLLQSMLVQKAAVAAECSAKEIQAVVRAPPEVASRRGFRAEWWARVDKYCQGACQKATVDDLVSYIKS